MRTKRHPALRLNPGTGKVPPRSQPRQLILRQNVLRPTEDSRRTETLPTSTTTLGPCVHPTIRRTDLPLVEDGEPCSHIGTVDPQGYGGLMSPTVLMDRYWVIWESPFPVVVYDSFRTMLDLTPTPDLHRMFLNVD